MEGRRSQGPLGFGLTRRAFLAGLAAGAAAPLNFGVGRGAWQEPVETAEEPSLLFDVRDFGALGDGAADDAPAINTAVRAATSAGPGATVLVPQGTYVLGTANGGGLGRTSHVLVRDARELTILGEPGSLLLVRDHTADGVLFVGCERVTARGLTIDYDPLPFTQGTVVAVDAAARSFDWRLDGGYPDPTEKRFVRATAHRGMLYHPATGRLKAAAGSKVIGEVAPLGGGLFRFPVSGVISAAATETAVGDIEVGDRFVLMARSTGDGSAMYLNRSTECLVDAVTIYSSPVLAWGVFECDAMAFTNCVIEPMPGTNRLLSTNADGIHCPHNRRGPLIEGCRFTAMGDDAFNIRTSGFRVLEAESETEVLVEETIRFARVGDRVAVIAQASGLTRAVAIVASVGPARWRDNNALRLTLDRPIPDLVSAAMLGHSTIPPRLDQTTPSDRRPDLVADLDAVGSGFVIRGNAFAGLGSRIYSTNGVVENNRFENQSLNGIQFGNELFWPEAYHASNVVIRGNTFSSIPGSNIDIADTLARFEPAQGMGNQDIVIEGNTFEQYGGAGAIAVSNAQRVQIRNNTIGPGTGPAVTLGLCAEVSLEDNSVAADANPPLEVLATPETDVATVGLRGSGFVLLRRFQASRDFSDVQGRYQWSYQYWDGSAYHDMSYDAATQRWVGPGANLFVRRDFQHPGSFTSVRRWTAPADGVAAVRGRARKAPPGGGDGVRVEILHNQAVIWARDVEATDDVGFEHDLPVRVAAGDAMYFRVSRRVNNAFDATIWDPLVSLAPLP